MPMNYPHGLTPKYGKHFQALIAPLCVPRAEQKCSDAPSIEICCYMNVACGSAMCGSRGRKGDTRAKWPFERGQLVAQLEIGKLDKLDP
eukprot:1103477-Pelagomonas_calceolata.AAC.8